MVVQNPTIESSSVVLDWQALGNRCMGREDLVKRILGKFQEGLAGEFEKLEQACNDNDSDAIASIAHRIKGTSLTVSANRLAELAEQLREEALSYDLVSDRELASMRAEVERLTEHIAHRLSGEL